MLKKIISISLVFIATASVAKPLNIVLDWFVNPDHAPLFVAKQQGYFKKQGIQLNIIQPANSADGPKLVAAGKADIAIDYQPQLIIQVLNGLPLVRFGTLVNTPLSCLIALKNGPIKTIGDLKGKKVAYSPGFSDVLLSVMLQHHGLTLNDITKINVNYNLVQALLTHNVDAFTGGMRNFEAIEIKLAGQQPKLFLPEKNGIPSYDELIFVANKEEVNDPRLIKFLIALKQGVTYLKQHPQQTWKIFAKNHQALNNRLNHDAWFASIKYFDNTPAKLNTKKYIKFTEFLKAQHVIQRIPPLNDCARQLS